VETGKALELAMARYAFLMSNSAWEEEEALADAAQQEEDEGIAKTTMASNCDPEPGS